MELSVTRADFAADAGSAQPIQQILQIFILTIFGKSADEIQSAVRRKTEQSNLIRHGIPLHVLGVDGALYKSMEFTGPGVASLSMDDRLSICNMAIEAGAKNGIFPVDDVTKAYLKGRSQREPVFYEADPDAEYEKTIEIDLSALEPTVSYPHLPENTHPASEGKDIKIDQVVIGSCTNGRLEDMEAAYNILKGKHIAKGVRGIIIPATMAVYKVAPSGMKLRPMI